MHKLHKHKPHICHSTTEGVFLSVMSLYREYFLFFFNVVCKYHFVFKICLSICSLNELIWNNLKSLLFLAIYFWSIHLWRRGASFQNRADTASGSDEFSKNHTSDKTKLLLLQKAIQQAKKNEIHNSFFEKREKERAAEKTEERERMEE